MERRYATSAIIYNESGLVLLARRAPNKIPFPNVLSLPSTYIKDDDGNPAREPIYDSMKQRQLVRAVKKKLGVEVGLEGVLGQKEGVQADYWLTMTDYFARIIEGEIKPNGKDFSEAFYVDPVETFADKDRTEMGFCTQILLESLDKNPDFLKKYLLNRTFAH